MTADSSTAAAAGELVRQWLAAGVANAATSALLNPLDVAKTRMQTQVRGGGAPSLRAALAAMHAEGGVLRGLFLPGLGASMVREMLSSGCRAGFYAPVRDAIARVVGDQGGAGGKGEHWAPKLSAAMTTGIIGSLVANPVDVVKIRLFNEPARYPSLARALAAVHKAEGVAGLYKGLAPSTLRAAFIAAGELGTYDVAKTALKGVLPEEGVALHVAASLVTGVVAAFVAAPFDLVKARAMADDRQTVTIGSALRQLRREGGLPWSLFRGVVPAYLRLGPHALICFPIFERLRFALGLDYL